MKKNGAITRIPPNYGKVYHNTTLVTEMPQIPNFAYYLLPAENGDN